MAIDEAFRIGLRNILIFLSFVKSEKEELILFHFSGMLWNDIVLQLLKMLGLEVFIFLFF